MKRNWFPVPSTLLKNCPPLRLGATLSLLGILLTLAAGSVAQASLLGTAGEYGEFILGDSTRSFVDAQGKVAVGGNANFNSFAVASLQSGSTTNLVVGGTLTANSATVQGHIVTGGNATYTQPTVNGNFSSNGVLTLGNFGSVNGNIRYGTGYSPLTTTVNGSVAGPVATPLPVDFAAEAAYLTALSAAQVNPLDPTGTMQFGQLFVAGVAGANFFNITPSQMQSATGGYNISAPAGATVVLNVSGNNVTVNNTGFNFSGGLTVDHVLWNFYEATTVTIQGSAHGSFLAPLAAVVTTNGGFNGNLIAGSLTGSIETHIYDFGDGPPTFFDGELRPPVPEPASLGMLLVAAIGGAGLLRRRTA